MVDIIDSKEFTIIENVVCKHYETTPDNLRSKSRKRDKCAEPRQVIWKLCNDVLYGYFSTTKLGLTYNRNHATVISGVKKIQNIIDTQSLFMEKYNMLLSELSLIYEINKHEKSITRQFYDMLYDMPKNTQEGTNKELYYRETIKALSESEKHELKAQIDGIMTFCDLVNITLKHC